MNPQEKVHHKQPMSKTSTRSERDELVKSKLEVINYPLLFRIDPF